MKNIKCRHLPKYLAKENVLLIDVRTPIEYNKSHIPKSFNIPMDTLLKKVVHYLNKEYLYFILCSDGSRSRDVCKQLLKQNYRAFNVKGGMSKWKGQTISKTNELN